MQYLNLRSNTEREIQRTCTAIADSIELQIQQMDTACLNTIHSTVIKDTFYAYLNDTEATAYEQNQRRGTIASELIATRGVDTSIRQINLYGFSNGGYGAGNYTGDLNVNAPDEFWYENTKAMHGEKYIPPAVQNLKLSSKAGTDDDRYYTSLYRMYYDKYHVPAGFVEVAKYYDVLFEQAYYPETNYDLSIVIYDSSGSVLFPLDQDESDFSYFSYIDSRNTQLYNTEENCYEHVYFSDLEYCDFTVAASINSSDFFAPVYRSLLWIALIFLFALILCILFASYMSKKISAPIKEIYHFLYHIDPKNQFQKLKMESSGIIEIDKLHRSLNEAMKAQKSATDSMILLKEQEMQSQMLALQSQMNPHFLYNSLSTVAAMADEGMTEPIVQMCEDITSILRYISSNKEQTSSLEEELEHCNLYLKCMKLRFGNSLHYDFDVPDDMLELPVPKLCIQLLVENSIKFSTQTPPPWNVIIRGHTEGNNWFIDVEDNGPGFDQKSSELLKSKMDEILKNGLLPSLEINGMGILNIFIRLYLLYGISFIFDFKNLPDKGAIVTIGGQFNDQDKPL